MNTSAWRYYTGLYEGHYRPLLLSAVVSIAQSVLVLPIALLVRHAFDNLIPAGELRPLVLAGAALAALYLLNGAATLWTRHLVLRTSKTVIQAFREEMLKRLYAFSRSYYDRLEQGDLHTILVQDTERLDVMTNALLAQFLPAVCVSLVLVGVLAYLNWVLFLTMLCAFPPLFLASRVVGRRVRERTWAFHRAFETFSRGVLFVLQMMDLTRMRAAEESELARQSDGLTELRESSANMAWIKTAHVLLHDTIVAVAGVIILIAGGAAVALGSMTLGGLLSFYAAIALLRPQLRTIFSCLPQIVEGNESLKTLYDLLQTPDARPYSGTRPVAFRGGITLDDVSFRYQGPLVLQGVSLAVDPGRTIAIVGPNGSGKSTIAYLILGFYRPEGGEVRADSCPYTELNLVALRRQIGVVPQTQMLFSGTILENIAYGHADPSLERVQHAARLATAHDFVQRLPAGYDTLVGERGVRLSGGERQRIAIARALFVRPRLLILDEPTVHLDSAAVSQLMQNLESLSDPPATILISHDLDVVQEAERVYLLDGGRTTVCPEPAALAHPRIAAPSGGRIAGEVRNG